MNWSEDCGHNMNAVTYGFSNMSASFIPRSKASGIWRFFMAVLITAGLIGATFEVMQCAHIISKVVNGPKTHSAAAHHAHRKDR
jgi:hypothetical protein